MKNDSGILLNAIIEGILQKKGNEVVALDLQEIDSSVCDYFVICHGDSTTQVEAIANAIEDTVEETLEKRARYKEGRQNLQWVLLDYGAIVVHVFQKPFRQFYNLEDLWADAVKTEYNEAYKPILTKMK